MRILLIIGMMLASSVVYATSIPHTISSVSEDLGIDVAGVNIQYGEPETGGMENVAASFRAPNTIIVKRGLSKEHETRAIAHEYVHYAASKENQGKITGWYREYFSQNEWITQRLAQYECDEDCMGHEALAYACTEMPKYLLNREYHRYCDGIIPNRDILF